MFQYPLVDRVGFEGYGDWCDECGVIKFQYPLVDRVGFEGNDTTALSRVIDRFSILWWIELVLRVAVAVGGCGVQVFQYPLVDRVGFEGAGQLTAALEPWRFSILWWIELVLRVQQRG